MHKILPCLAALVFVSPAWAQSAEDYLAKVFNGSSISDGESHVFVKSGQISCATVRLRAGRHTLVFPPRSVELSLTRGSSSGVRFACINGGGCISWTADHGVNWVFIDGFTSEVTKSISNAFAALQESCGGAEKRPF